jgi:undecaprenyl-diphosphatase
LTAAQAALLGAVQGVTEFLPVSSDGHLALFQAGLGLEDASLALDVALHAGTLVAILLFFARDLAGLFRSLVARAPGPAELADRRRVWLIAVATVPTGIIGLSLKGAVEARVTSYGAAGIGFLLTALILAAAALRRSPADGGEPSEPWGAKKDGLPWGHALALGVAQGAAVWPGLSRSGSTIAVALLLGWSWREAGRFSFLMALPALAGALLLSAKDIASLPGDTVAVGFTTALVVGCLSLAVLMRFLRARRLWPFSIYCALAGAYALVRAAG